MGATSPQKVSAWLAPGEAPPLLLLQAARTRGTRGTRGTRRAKRWIMSESPARGAGELSLTPIEFRSVVAAWKLSRAAAACARSSEGLHVDASRRSGLQSMVGPVWRSRINRGGDRS